MIRGKENLLKWVKQNDCPYWKIYPHGSSRNNFFANSSEEPNLSMTDSLERLESSLELLESGRYVITCKTSTTQTKGFHEIAFEHQNTFSPLANNNAVSGPQVTGLLTMEMLNERLKEEREKVNMDWEMKRLKERNEDLEKKLKEAENNGTDAALSGIIKRLDPYVDPVLNHFFPVEGKTKVAAVGFKDSEQNKSNNNNHTTMQNQNFTPPTTRPQDDEEASKRSQIALQAWADADPENFLAMVEKIASVAVNDPNTYKMYVPMLLK
jgi:hypothetical protein